MNSNTNPVGKSLWNTLPCEDHDETKYLVVACKYIYPTVGRCSANCTPAPTRIPEAPAERCATQVKNLRRCPVVRVFLFGIYRYKCWYDICKCGQVHRCDGGAPFIYLWRNGADYRQAGASSHRRRRKSKSASTKIQRCAHLCI